MDVLPHSTDVFEGPTHKEAMERVKIRMEVEDSVEDIVRGSSTYYRLEMRSAQRSECEQEAWRRLTDSGDGLQVLAHVAQRLLHG